MFAPEPMITAVKAAKAFSLRFPDDASPQNLGR